MLKMTSDGYCLDCRIAFKRNEMTCKRCGKARGTTSPKEPKLINRSPNVAAVLSAICPGLGQIYNGQYVLGVVCLFFTTTLIHSLIIGIATTGVIVGIGIWLFAVTNCYKYATKYGVKQDTK